MLTGVFSSFSPDERRFCVFSLAASTDGKEILGGLVTYYVLRKLPPESDPLITDY